MRNFAWLPRWHRWLANDIGLSKWLGRATPLVSIAIPSIVVAYIIMTLSDDSILAALFFGIAVLLLCSGPRDIVRDIEDYKTNYLDTDDRGAAPATGNILSGLRADTDDPDGPYLEAIAVAANDALFAPAFWFAVAGPLGAIAFRSSSVLARSAVLDPGAHQFADHLYLVLLWLPARLFAVGLGLAGSLSPVFAAFARSAHGLTDSEQWLGETARAALDEQHHVSDSSAEHVDRIASMLALVKRGFVVFLVVLALLVAAGIL
jgi:membrane protein required for beta-lactamase induction